MKNEKIHFTHYVVNKYKLIMLFAHDSTASNLSNQPNKNSERSAMVEWRYNILL